jgi:hypothetical protein
MKDKYLKLQDTEASHTLGGAGEGRSRGEEEMVPSDTLTYINLAEVALGLVALRGPMHLCACVSEERGDREGAGSQALSCHSQNKEVY